MATPSYVYASVTPEMFGAAGDGTIDDTAALSAANTVAGYVTLSPGKTYRITADLSLGAIVPNDSYITIDSGKVLTFDTVLGDPASVVFKGAGVAKSSGHSYSIGWYDGATLNAKWDFLRRALVRGVPYEVDLVKPHATDPAAFVGGINPFYESGTVGWKLTSALVFDDPEDDAIIYQRCPIIATVAMTRMLEFSPVNKTENIVWPFGHDLQGNGYANYGIDIHGGARLQFNGYSRAHGCLVSGVRINTDLYPCDEPWWDFLDTTGSGSIGLDVEGGAGGVVLGGHVGYHFNNGMVSGATHIQRLRGNIRGFRIDDTLENTNTAAGFAEPSISITKVENSSNGAVKSAFLGKLRGNTAAVPGVIVSDTTSGVGAKASLEVGMQDLPNYAGSPIQLAWMEGGTIHPQRHDANAPATLVTIGLGVDAIDVHGVDLRKITGHCAKLTLDGRYVLRETLADDTATFITLPANASGLVTVMCVNDANAVALFYVRNGASMISINAGSSANLTTGALTGTTGTDVKLNISVSANNLYIENRQGLSRDYVVIAEVG